MIQLTNFWHRIASLMVLSTVIGCTYTEPVHSKTFPEKNRPEHVFKFKYEYLRDSIISMFTLENQNDNAILKKVFYQKVPSIGTIPLTFEAESSKDTVFSKSYFAKPGTSNDIFLHDFRSAWPSKFYYSGFHPLEYTADFIVKFSKIDDSSTKVSIIAFNPEVVNGISGYGPHGAIARYTPVMPTTIEEYDLLEFIASELRDSTLLPIKLPKN